jgi:hypothetical protein
MLAADLIERRDGCERGDSLARRRPKAHIGHRRLIMYGIALSHRSTADLARHCATKTAAWLGVIGSIYAAGSLGHFA